MQRRDKGIASLLRWFRIHGRSLPWRGIDDPYQIFISEIMLQQTQASRVIEYFESWIKQFPTWESLAKAKTPDLFQSWAGLGYNRRALYIREAAKQVIERGIPKTEEEWRALKGVGPYTAAAVYAFTTKRPAPAIDTNIRRVIGRSMLGLPFPTLQDDPRVLQALKKALTEKGDWLALHALMDVGATICLPKSPRCEACPLREQCKARTYFTDEQTKNTSRPKQKSRERIHEGKKIPDRIYRGRILKLIQEKKSILIHRIGALVDETFVAANDEAWLLRMIDRMKRDGFIEQKNDRLTIPRQ